MEDRKRNTAIVFIAAGLFLLIGKIIGFFAASLLALIALGLYMIRSNGDKSAYVLVAVCGVILAISHFVIIVALVLILLGYYYLHSKRLPQPHVYFDKRNVVQSIKWDKDPWVLKSMNFRTIVGEFRMDMSLALPEEAETTLVLNGIVGDIDIFVPEDWGLSIDANVVFGQIVIGRNKEAGLMNRVLWQTPDYEQRERKLKLVVSFIVADLDIKLI